ncbi:M48 family metalloprotease [Endozoicomonas ascidiicola]|uniref:M48 family metalloprotease n=1 Tax=Endozoicomonas ascidiicola TaxID=1698521 RepID=UPI000B2EE67B|nr:M48 family metalloprotease [Endozoicomonas ascidiicola]
MLFKVRYLLLFTVNLWLFFLSFTSIADVNAETYSLNQEEILVSQLHRSVDRGLLNEIKENGLASIAGAVAAATVGVSWEGVGNIIRDGIHSGNPLSLDFTVRALLKGTTMGAMAVISRAYLKTPFDLLSRPLAWVGYKHQQVSDWVYHKETSAELSEKYAEFFNPVAERLTRQVELVFDIPTYYWTISLMDMGAPNAFATSGYNIGIYHSIFPLAKSQAGMACILGHEMGHVLAKHIGQRISDLIFMNVIAVSSIPFINAISQNHETQADEIGAYLTALAGYDPSECSKVWERMTTFAGDRREIVNIFMSSHPTNTTRKKALNELGEQLQEYYSNRQEKLGLGLEFTL